MNGVFQCLSIPLQSTTTRAIWVLKCLNLSWLASFASYPTRYENQNNWYTFLLSTSHPWLSGLSLCPDLLKMTLCLIPLLLLLWLNTFETKSEDREPLLKLVFQITLDLFDGTEMLQVIPEVNDLGIPKRFEEAIITFVCIRFMLSHFQLVENKISDKSIYK